MLNALKVLYKHFSQYWKNFLWLFLFSIGSPFFESIGVLLFLPIFSTFFSNDTSNEPFFLQEYIDIFFNFLGWDVSTFNLTIVIVVMLFAKAIFLYLGEMYIIRFSEFYSYSLRKRLFTLYRNTKWEFFTSQKRGFLLDYLISIPNANTVLLRHTSISLAVVFSISTYFLFSLFFSFNLTVFAIILVLFLVMFYLKIMKKIKFYGTRATFSRVDLTKTAEQSLAGFKTLKAFGVLHSAHNEFNQENTLLKNSLIEERRFNISYKVGAELIISIFLLSLLLVAIKIFDYPVEEIVLVTIFLGRCLQQMGKLQSLGVVAANLANVELIEEVMDEFSLQKDVNTSLTETPIQFEEKIELQNLSFSYIDNDASKKDSATTILDTVSLSIKKGTMVGIVGGSGAGKSTLIDILMGFLKPTDGAVYIDKLKLSKISQLSWAKLIGYVPQDTFLLHGTITENISFYRDIPQEKIIEAAKMANCYDFIQEAEKGFDTLVGDNGVKLSGGQRQRIALARALAGNPQFLILDEATSALDSKSENIIQKSIEKIRKNNLTIISIAHRLSTIINADTIIVLDKGKIAEKGNKEELLNKKGLFYQMYQDQEKFHSLD